jgi:hypothetical protein
MTEDRKKEAPEAVTKAFREITSQLGNPDMRAGSPDIGIPPNRPTFPIVDRQTNDEKAHLRERAVKRVR